MGFRRFHHYQQINMIVKEEFPENPLLMLMFELPYYKLFYESFGSQRLNADWFQHIKALPFEKSHFGVNDIGKEQRAYDDTVRLSEFTKVKLPELDQIALYYMRCWSLLPPDMILSDGLWNALRYPNGLFAWHMDKVRPKEGWDHMGTIITIPPSNMVRYKGGCLIIVDISGKQLFFNPHQTQWLFIIIPLGYMHTVQPVEGLRYSFTREVYFKEGHGMRKLTETDKQEIRDSYNEKSVKT